MCDWGVKETKSKKSYKRNNNKYSKYETRAMKYTRTIITFYNTILQMYLVASIHWPIPNKG